MTGATGIHEQIIGDDHGQGAVRALVVVSGELMETIRSAHLALEDCVDGRGGTPALTRAGELLHQAWGALHMTETYGAALLVEEMELACKYLSSLRAGRGRDDGLEALTRSMVQLPIYIEGLLGGGRDIALVLLPILNDLRAARGEPLLSEGTLLLLNLSPNRTDKGVADRAGSGEDPVLVAKRLRPKFQLALLGWIKGGDNQRHIETLAKVAAAVEHSATRDDMYQLWWVVGGVLESLQNGGLETSIAIKRLLGQTDRQLKYVIDEGVSAYDAHPVTDLLNNLLYYVARSSNAGERISEIRAAFNLAELMPGDEQVENAREALSAPSARLMETVGAAIKEDLGRVKDVLDIFVRTGMNKSSELVPQLELLKKISDTLGVLGLGELRGDIDSEIDRLKAVVEHGGVANDQTILDIASTLLRVEDRLDRQLVRLSMPQEPDAGALDEGAEEDRQEMQQVAESVMRECIINLARIKETITQSMTAQAPSHGLDSVPSLIRGIKAGLLMLDKPRAMEVVDRIGSLVTAMLNSGGPGQLTQRETDRLADAIVSIEYYMETVKAGRSEPWYMLDNAEGCLAVLRSVEQRLLQARAEEATGLSRTTRLSAAEIETLAADGEQARATQTPALQVPEVVPLPVVSSRAKNMDPELIELFIEEAKEEIASIRRHLPAWVASPDSLEALVTVRRSFHTLKGSGRMVGAERIGEYCWAVENLLNRLLNRTLVRTPPMVEFVEQAAEAVPQLVEQLEVGTEPDADISLFIVRAHAFADGNPNAAVLTLEQPARAARASEAAAPEMDPVLHDIFSKETAGHLRVITDYFHACEGYEPPFPVTDKLYRACHTLHGSANMANVQRGVAVAAALNRFVRRVHDHKVGFQQSGLDAVRAAAEAIETIVGDINNPDRERADYGALVEHLVELADALVAGETAVPVQVPAPTPSPRPQAPPGPVVEFAGREPEYDAEIASIFTEESAELLEASDTALAEWIRARSGHAMDELKRHLHTLKGGARMAGIAAMGNLSHELETLLISVDEKRVEANTAVEDLLQRSIDELHRMRDTVIAGKPVRTATELAQRIQQVIAVGGLAEARMSRDETDVSDAPSARFTAEPEDAVSVVIDDAGSGDALPDLGQEFSDEPPLLELPAHDETGQVPASEELPTDQAEDEILRESDDRHAELLPDVFDGAAESDIEREPERWPTSGSPLDELSAAAAVADVGSATDATPPVPGAVDDTAAAGDESDAMAAFADGIEVQEGQEPQEGQEAQQPQDGQELQEGQEPQDGQEVQDAQDRDEAPAAMAEEEVAAEEHVVESPGEAGTDAVGTVEQPAEITPAIDEYESADVAAESGQPAAAEGAPDEQIGDEARPAAVAELRPLRSPEQRHEFARVDADLLEDLLNAAGEITIYHSRLNQQVASFEFHVAELEQTISRLREQLRKLDNETEAQIMHGHQETVAAHDFDPLELDRYSNIQQLSRALSESASDLSSLKDLLRSVTSEAEGLLVQQSRVTAELQDGLMRTRMVPFERHVPRLTRLVRQAAKEAGKRAELAVEGASGELDRQVLEKMLPPFEHMLRNAVVHGIEDASERQAAGKPAIGRITIRLHREGAEMVIDVADDGSGLDVDAIRRKAYELDMLEPESKVTDDEIMELILTPGFTTATSVTQSAGRGVGMDVVANEVKKLGGSLRISSVTGQGTNFTVRLPFTLAITQALIVRTGDEVYALPLPTVEGVARIPRDELENLLSQSEPSYQYGEQSYKFRHLGMYLGGQAANLPEDDTSVPVILVRAGDYSAALLVDEMLASREIVVKAVGPQLAGIRGISGATILGDGRIILILDINALVRTGAPVVELKKAAPTPSDDRPLALVVDDSITVRRVTERFLHRNGMRVETAKDGLDAISVMQDHKPDIILLDIEMPRMDGYEFASHVRNDPQRVPTYRSS